jgi:hypothetical protein
MRSERGGCARGDLLPDKAGKFGSRKPTKARRFRFRLNVRRWVEMSLDSEKNLAQATANPRHWARVH